MNQHSGSEHQINDTQRRLVWNHLVKLGPITAIQAQTNYGIARLGARIFELRQQKHDIITEMVEVETRYGKRKVAQYTLMDVQKQLVMGF